MNDDLTKTSSMDEWREYGERLSRLHHEIVALSVDMSHTVPKTMLRDMEKADGHISKIRSDLEGRMTEEHDPEDWDLDVFYGGVSDDYTEWRDALADDEDEWLWSEDDVTDVPCPECGEVDRVGLNRTNLKGDKLQSPHRYRCYRCEHGFGDPPEYLEVDE